MTHSISRVLIVAGEASGDLHGANLIHALKRDYPALQIDAMGASNMQKAGANLLVNSSNIAVVGVLEVLLKFPEIFKAWYRLKRYLKSQQPDLVILIDYPGFNLRLARLAHKLKQKVLYYVSPQVWAWKKKRIHTIKRCVKHIAVIFPFEKRFYDEADVPATYVGHPLLDEIKLSLTPEQTRAYYELPDAKRFIAMLPGSRNSEIQTLFPMLIETAEKLHARYDSHVHFLIPLAATLPQEKLEHYLKDTQIQYTIIKEYKYEALSLCNAAMVASGTATLELALLNIPMVLTYKIHPVSYFIVNLFASYTHIGICNIMADKTIIKEMLQQHATTENLYDEMIKLLEDEQYRLTMLSELKAVTDPLREKTDCSEEVAGLVKQLASCH